ncbi:MAG: carboxypeptidase M32 [Planctomycetota bacterium]|nr:carboxypeptidase M32 [Planctomycetota bacterium]
MPNPQDLFDDLITRLKQTAVLASCSAVLGWDEQTSLPPGGAEHRAEQLGLLAGLVHQRATDPRIGELLSELEASNHFSPETADGALLREARRDFNRKTKLPQRLVEQLSRTTTLSQQAWVDARKRKDFNTFQPWLEQVVTLKREEADALSAGGEKYDSLLDDYESGATSALIAEAFAALRTELVPLLEAIRTSGIQPDASLITRRFPVDAQRAFGRAAAKAIGFDFQRGRLDEAAHPFCSGIGPGDCRLTTRYDEYHFPQAFFGTLHEAGHGLYEQGLPAERFGTPLGEACSLGIHESQSRMWENFVGRSWAFWSHFFPQAQRAFPEALTGVDAESLYRAVNDVRPTFVRVEADEVTYNLHIMLRFELERPLIAGDLSPADVPEAWDAIFQRDFGLKPSNVSEGCLQDIHWSAGLIGYFPTYTLGNMYAAQLFEQARADLGDLDAMFRAGEFEPLKSWLVENVHQHGRRYRPTELIERVTGAAPSPAPLVAHLRTKYGELYRL